MWCRIAVLMILCSTVLSAEPAEMNLEVYAKQFDRVVQGTDVTVTIEGHSAPKTNSLSDAPEPWAPVRRVLVPNAAIGATIAVVALIFGFLLGRMRLRA